MKSIFTSIRLFLILKIDNMPRPLKKIFFLFLDILLCFFTSWISFCLRFDELVPLSESVLLTGFIAICISIPILVKFGLYRAIFRYNSWGAATSLIKAISFYLLFFLFIFTIIGITDIPRSIGIIQPVLFFISLSSSRLFVRYLLSCSVASNLSKSNRKYVLIYGAGNSGQQIASLLNGSSEKKPIAFVDDNPRYWGSLVNNIPVYPPSEISNLLESNSQITDILLAIPSASSFQKRQVLNNLCELPVRVKKIPSLHGMATGEIRFDDFLDIDIDDLLSRDTNYIDKGLLEHNIANKSVLVTGAGGSIGSELCRQLIKLDPQTLVLYELNEYALYSIQRQLAKIKPNIEIIPILGSVLDKKKLTHTCLRFRIDTFFHAAAYKHVPIIEANPSAGVCNNVFGTLHSVDAALDSGVKVFVLISTDKAVRPTNIMGCSKRLSELIVQAKHNEINVENQLLTKLTMVRFGNVLGSSGSVVPLFKEQINHKGPVTVTHPEITRYFMTIPEAAQLVIQAAAIGEGGEVMVLDMGEPVKILDLAKRMIHLSGYTYKECNTSSGDIEIQFTGLRPGEKLFEELLIGKNILSTPHPRILRAMEDSLSWKELKYILHELEQAVDLDDDKLILSLLKKVIPEFHNTQLS